MFMKKGNKSVTDALGQLTKGAGVPQPSLGARSKQKPPPSRTGKKAFLLYLDPAVGEVLRDLAHEKRTSQTALFKEALNMLFRAEGKPTIA
jgi:hypothetical protein